MADPIRFKKMHGSGNDFILVDNRKMAIPLERGPEVAQMLCRPKFGIGADGLILIGESQVADFKWYFYNADGSEAEMCGNGGRCAARFAYTEGIADASMRFETIAGIISAEVSGKTVKLQLPTPEVIEPSMTISVREWNLTGSYLNTGVPHFVNFVEDVQAIPVYEMGRLVRHHEAFQPHGTNCDFVEVRDKDYIVVRTYERGVEDETLACGTGAVASAIACALLHRCIPPITVETWGGERLKVYFELTPEGVRDVFLEGEAIIVYSGVLDGDLAI